MTAFQPEPFGKYYLVDKIAVGGMAEIFKAKSFGHGGFEKLLVIKRILPHISANEEFVEMFVDEAKVSVALQHANIVQTYDFGKVVDNWFIAMECVEGKDVKALLRKLAQRRRFLPIEFGVYLAHEVAKGLDYAHRRQNLQGNELGIVHRDISPSNVIISYDGEVKIADFGIAKATTNAYTTKDGVLKGKFEYMSPEQAQGQGIDRRSDIFSCGIILYECLTGRRLFKGESDVQTLEAIKACNLDPPSSLNPSIPARLDEIVLRALAQRREDRYSEARELQNDLLEFLYPATPDLVRQSFAHFLKELFTEEISGERYRLEEGTRIAWAMHHQAPDLDLQPEWEEPRTTASHTLPGAVGQAPARPPWLLAMVGLGMLLIVGAIVGAVGWIALHPREPVVTAPEVTTGRLLVLIDTDAEVLVDGQSIGQGQQVAVEELSVGAHQIEVRAEGMQPFLDTISVEAGERVRFPVRLEPEVVTPPVQPPRPDTPRHVTQPDPEQNPAPVDPVEPIAELATITFRSSPSGATVVVDGASVGRTPVTWTGGQPGVAVYVEYRLDGYHSQGFSVRVPEAGERGSESRSLKQVAKEPGHVSVNVSRGWAYVYIDGKKLDETTPLINQEIPPGSHTIRVQNESLGIDATKTVQIESGEGVERVFLKVD